MSGSKSSDAFFAPGASPPVDAAAQQRSAGDTALVALVEQSRTRTGRWKLLLLMLVFAAPVVLSYFTYYVIRPEGRTNFGTLINPQRAMPEQALVTALDGSTRRLGELKGQWLLVSVAPGACDATCRNNLYLQRQIRESLGREKDRLDWIWLVSDAQALPSDIRAGLAQASVLRMDGADIAGWLQPEDGHALAKHLYLVDPMGHWMMRMPADLDAKGAAKARRDIERLLRASSSWDRAGREELQ